jgi:hypothetical protein
VWPTPGSVECAPSHLLPTRFLSARVAHRLPNPAVSRNLGDRKPARGDDGVGGGDTVAVAHARLEFGGLVTLPSVIVHLAIPFWKRARFLHARLYFYFGLFASRTHQVSPLAREQETRSGRHFPLAPLIICDRICHFTARYSAVARTVARRHARGVAGRACGTQDGALGCETVPNRESDAECGVCWGLGTCCLPLTSRLALAR